MAIISALCSFHREVSGATRYFEATLSTLNIQTNRLLNATSAATQHQQQQQQHQSITQISSLGRSGFRDNLNNVDDPLFNHDHSTSVQSRSRAAQAASSLQGAVSGMRVPPSTQTLNSMVGDDSGDITVDELLQELQERRNRRRRVMQEGQQVEAQSDHPVATRTDDALAPPPAKRPRSIPPPLESESSDNDEDRVWREKLAAHHEWEQRVLGTHSGDAAPSNPTTTATTTATTTTTTTTTATSSNTNTAPTLEHDHHGDNPCIACLLPLLGMGATAPLKGNHVNVYAAADLVDSGPRSTTMAMKCCGKHIHMECLARILAMRNIISQCPACAIPTPFTASQPDPERRVMPADPVEEGSDNASSGSQFVRRSTRRSFAAGRQTDYEVWVCCDNCDKWYKAFDVNLTSESTPPGPWYCPDCAVISRKPKRTQESTPQITGQPPSGSLDDPPSSVQSDAAPLAGDKDSSSGLLPAPSEEEQAPTEP